MKRVAFISHSSADNSVAEKVCHFLESNGVPCWIAPRDVTPGKNYGAAIVDAIDECSVFVLLLTKDSNKSGQVVREVERAASSNSIVIPFRLQDVHPSRDLEFYVSATHWLDAVTEPFDKHLRELLTAIRDWQTRAESNEDAAPILPSAAAAAAPTIPARPEHNSATGYKLIIGLVVAFVFFIVLRSLVFRHDNSSRALASTPIPSEPPRAESATPAPSAWPTPVRRRPGALSRPSATPEVTPAVSASPSPSVVPVQPSPSLPPMIASPTPVKSVPIIRHVSASSELTLNGQIRSASHAVDGAIGTAWVPEGDGIGASLTIHFDGPATITSVSILTALATDMQYKIRNRVHTLRVTFAKGTTQVLTLEDRGHMQRFELTRPVTAPWVRFDILTVYRGEKLHHTPIFEIAFNRGVE